MTTPHPAPSEQATVLREAPRLNAKNVHELSTMMGTSLNRLVETGACPPSWAVEACHLFLHPRYVFAWEKDSLLPRPPGQKSTNIALSGTCRLTFKMKPEQFELARAFPWLHYQTDEIADGMDLCEYRYKLWISVDDFPQIYAAFMRLK